LRTEEPLQTTDVLGLRIRCERRDQPVDLCRHVPVLAGARDLDGLGETSAVGETLQSQMRSEGHAVSLSKPWEWENFYNDHRGEPSSSVAATGRARGDVQRAVEGCVTQENPICLVPISN